MKEKDIIILFQGKELFYFFNVKLFILKSLVSYPHGLDTNLVLFIVMSFSL